LADTRSDDLLELLRVLLARYTRVQATPVDYKLAGDLYSRCRA